MKFAFYILILIIIFMACSLPVEEESSEYFYYESFISLISIDGENFETLVNHAGGVEATSADIYWLGDKSQFLVNRDDLYIYDLEGTLVKEIRIPDCNIDIDTSPNGDNIAIRCGGDGSDLYIIDTESFKMKKITNTPSIVERYPRFSSDGKKIVYVCVFDKEDQEKPAIKLYDMDSDSSVTLITVKEENLHSNPFVSPCFGKNDEILYYMNNYNKEINYSGTTTLYSYNLITSEISEIDKNAIWFTKMQYAPAGDRLVYLTREPFCGIKVFDANTQSFYNLGDKIHEECRAIGPNQILNINSQGTHVIAGTDYCSSTHIYAIDIEKAEYKEIALGTSPALNNDDKTILFVKTFKNKY